VTDSRAAALYAAVFIPAGALAVALSSWVMDLSMQQAPRAPSGVDGWTLNIVPAFVVGLLSYFALSRFAGAGRTQGRSLSRHFLRSAALYLIVVGLGAVLLHDAGSPEFWSMGQIVLWLWLAALGGIVADGLMGRAPSA
jgi:hypothetical protein